MVRHPMQGGNIHDFVQYTFSCGRRGGRAIYNFLPDMHGFAGHYAWLAGDQKEDQPFSLDRASR